MSSRLSPLLIECRTKVASTERPASSTYAGIRNGMLVRLLDSQALTLHEHRVHDDFRDFIVNQNHPCVGARAAFNTGFYRFGIYSRIASPDTTAGLAYDLDAFAAELPSLATAVATFIAVFDDDLGGEEFEFEVRLWDQLQALHNYDPRAYDCSVSSNPEDPSFAFSFAGKAFFIVGLHPHSSRLARRFRLPALVFNPHSQFQRLRSKNMYDRFATVVRQRELALQGSLNPNLDPDRKQSEARQYSGRAVEEAWKCPFRP